MLVLVELVKSVSKRGSFGTMLVTIGFRAGCADQPMWVGRLIPWSSIEHRSPQ